MISEFFEFGRLTISLINSILLCIQCVRIVPTYFVVVQNTN
jgi:hypothetical protein